MTTGTPENPAERGLQLPDLQQHVKLSAQEIEKIKGGSLRGFFEGLFGQDSSAAHFLTNVTNWVGRVLGIQQAPIPDDQFFGMVDKQSAQAIEEGIIAHRGLGYHFRHPNTAKGIEAGLASGETEMEFDVRIGPDGRLMVRHDPFDGTNPGEGQSSFNDVLAVFQRYPSSKLFIDVKGGRETVVRLVEAMRAADLGSPRASSLFTRSALMMFNPDALAAARELAPQCPVFFHYFPTGGVATLDNVLMPAYQRGFIGHGQVAGALGAVDQLTGNTNLASGFRATSLHVNEQNPFSTPGSNPSEERLTTYSMLPPQSIIDMVRESGGALSVPWPLVRDWPRFFLRVRQAGVRLAVFGFEDPQQVGGDDPVRLRAAVKSHNTEVRRAIALGANMIITDHPNYFPEHRT